MSPNQDYEKGELKLRFFWRDGYPFDGYQFPMRFWSKDKLEAINAMRQYDWKTLNRLAIPPYTAIKPPTPAL